MTNEEVELRKLLNDLALAHQEDEKYDTSSLVSSDYNYHIGFKDCRKYVLERLKEIVGPKDKKNE